MPFLFCFRQVVRQVRRVRQEVFRKYICENNFFCIENEEFLRAREGFMKSTCRTCRGSTVWQDGRMWQDNLKLFVCRWMSISCIESEEFLRAREEFIKTSCHILPSCHLFLVWLCI